MTVQSLIAESAELVPFEDLALSDLNPRRASGEAGIEALAQNIRDLGLIQNLAGLRGPDGRVAVVAGGRRLRALALLQDDPRFRAVPVRIAPDEATAILWASSENHLREQPHPADEVREYGAMAARGVGLPAIAIAFGVTDAHVRRRLALAALPAPVLDALRQDEISLGQAAAFTVSDDEARGLAVLAQVRGHGYSDWQIKRWLKPDSVRSTDRRAAFVGRDDYLAAGGRLGGDLFADEDLFDSPDVLDRAFEAKLRAEAERLRTDQGWRWAETSLEDHVPYADLERVQGGRLYPVPVDLTEEEQERYEELSDLANAEALDDEGVAELDRLTILAEGDFTPEQKAHAGLLLVVDHRGELRVHAGIVRPEDRAGAEAAGVLSPSGHEPTALPKPPKPAISAALAEDLTRVARGARQNAALDHLDLLLDLLAFQLGGRLGHYHAFGLRAEAAPVRPTTGTGYALDERLLAQVEPPRDPWRADFAKAFRAYRKQGAEAVQADLARHLAALLDVDHEGLRALVDKEAKASVRAVWTPTAENFLLRVNGTYLDALWRDLLELGPEHPTATTFARLKKREKAEKLEALFADPRARTGITEAQAGRIARWLPEGMA